LAPHQFSAVHDSRRSASLSDLEDRLEDVSNRRWYNFLASRVICVFPRVQECNAQKCWQSCVHRLDIQVKCDFGEASRSKVAGRWSKIVYDRSREDEVCSWR
jgi:hypothetical protein